MPNVYSELNSLQKAEKVFILSSKQKHEIKVEVFLDLYIGNVLNN